MTVKKLQKSGVYSGTGIWFAGLRYFNGRIRKVIIESAENTLKKKYIRKCNQNGENKNPVWFSKSIESNIKKRRHYNRLSRNSKNQSERDLYHTWYIEQRKITKEMVRENTMNRT